MGTCVEEDDVAFGEFGEIFEALFCFKGFGGLVEIWVLFEF